MKATLFTSTILGALALAFALPVAPAAAQEGVICNPVFHGDEIPVIHGDGLYVIHSGSFDCPVEAPPAPAPIVPTEYLVFFDFDSSEITPEAAGIVARAADGAMELGSTGVSVVGHTDTSGSAAYNLGLSNRRANAVKGELEFNGVDGDLVFTDGLGETDLLVETPDGVREPSNRRAQILLQ